MTGKLTSARVLFKHALKDFWRYRWKLLGLVAVIAVPLAILQNIPGLSQDSGFSAYSSFVSLVMNIALIWIISRLRARRPATIREAYYYGTGALVRFVILAAVLTLSVIPFLLGAVVYISGVSGSTLAATNSEKILLALIWLVLALPSVWLFSRYFMSIYILIAEDATPLRSLRRSSQLVKGYTLPVMGRLLVLGLVGVAVMTLPAIGVVTGAHSIAAMIALVVLQLVGTLVVLPLGNLYLYGLYEKLAG